MKYILLVILWVAFGITHSYFISEGFIRLIQKRTGRHYRFYRVAYNIISLATFFPLLYYTKQIDSHTIITVHPVIQVVLLSLSGLIIVWAFFSFDVLEFLGVRQVISPHYNKAGEKKAEPLKKGLYGVIRHPMYFATIVFMWSLNSTFAQIIMKLILTVYIVVGVMLEERKLVKEYGTSYLEYQKEVPMLIPFLHLIRVRKSHH